MFRVVIVGRPNVGKSSLFNKITGERTSIVDATSGVTRDRIGRVLEKDSKQFELIDTGGIGIVDVQKLEDQVQTQINAGIGSADIILFMVDARDGITALDREVARRLRQESADVWLVANKVDNVKFQGHVGEFHQLGFGEPHVMSITQRRGAEELVSRIWRKAPKVDEAGSGHDDALPKDPLKIAFLGRRNVGKSSIVNCLANEDRVIVSEVAGTTRDAVDVLFERGDEKFVAIDTAGLRKRNKFDTQIDFYSTVRSNESVVRADVVALVLDAVEGLGRVDKRIADAIVENYKPCVIVVNKWDLAAQKTTPEEYAEYITGTLREFSHTPVVFVSAQTGQAIWDMIDIALDLWKQANERVSTGFLNNSVLKVLKDRAPSASGNQRPVVYYASQTEVAPPTIVFSVNHADRVKDNYRKYLLNALRKALPFKEVPIKMIFKSAHEKKGPVQKKVAKKGPTMGKGSANRSVKAGKPGKPGKAGAKRRG